MVASVGEFHVITRVCLVLGKWEDWPWFRAVLPNWMVG